MRKLFQRLERAEVEYLLIGGHAAVVYGATAFTEGVDLWLRPATSNVRRFLEALAALRAGVDATTPAPTRSNVLAGHVFRFLVPEKPLPLHLNAIGAPPRARAFESARRRSRRLQTPWGKLPVVGIEDLVVLKRTRRPEDYDVISDLVRIRLREEDPPSQATLRWAASATCRAEDRVAALTKLGARVSLAKCRRDVKSEVERWRASDESHGHHLDAALLRLQRAGEILEPGHAVAELVAAD